MRIPGGAIVAVALLAFIVTVIRKRPLEMVRPELTGDLTQTIGQAVLTRYVLPFELLAVLMLAGLLGAIYFARPED
jgi:NADH-quinone oxidoreductase subunit J